MQPKGLESAGELSDAVAIRSARPEHASAIVSLVRSGFAPDVLAYTIYGCEGVASYIHEELSAAAGLSARQFMVAVAAESVVGVVDATLSSRVHLNYITVHPAQQRSGLGTRMMTELAAFAYGRWHRECIALDVLDTNPGVLRWYESLGFSIESTTHWWTGVLPTTAKPVKTRACVAGLPFALRSLDRFGFASVQIATDQGEHTVGLLGDRLFRIKSTDLQDPDLTYTLGRLDRSRQLLVVAEDDLVPDVVWPRRVQTLRRMSALSESVLRLAERRGYTNAH